jgi:hypothetical protein
VKISVKNLNVGVTKANNREQLLGHLAGLHHRIADKVKVDDFEENALVPVRKYK